MQPLPQPVAVFLAAHHVVSLAVHGSEGMWAASCFYAFDEEEARLVVLTKPSTRHGRMMLGNPRIAGTVAGQPEHIHDIRGVQFTAWAEYLNEGAARKTALKRYIARHPIARLVPAADMWNIRLDDVKYTDNQRIFARKLYWQRDA